VTSGALDARSTGPSGKAPECVGADPGSVNPAEGADCGAPNDLYRREERGRGRAEWHWVDASPAGVGRLPSSLSSSRARGLAGGVRGLDWWKDRRKARRCRGPATTARSPAGGQGGLGVGSGSRHPPIHDA